MQHAIATKKGGLTGTVFAHQQRDWANAAFVVRRENSAHHAGSILLDENSSC